MAETRKCGHPLGSTRWCPDCELAESATPHPAPAVAEPAGAAQKYDSTGAMACAWFGTSAPEAVERVFGAKPAVAAEAGRMTPAQRLSELANGVRLGHCPDAGLLAKRMDAIAAAINNRPSSEAGQGDALIQALERRSYRAEQFASSVCVVTMQAVREEVRQALATQPAPPSQGQWLPIETADLKGSPVLVAGEDGELALAHFNVCAWSHFISGVPMLWQPNLKFKPKWWTAAPTQPPAEGGV